MLPLLEVLRRAESYFKKHAVASPRLSAEILLARVLGVDRLGLYLSYDRPLVESELASYRALVSRRAAHEPLEYILGTASFRSIEVAVGPAVLVPRPETEQLVELVLGLMDRVVENTGSKGREPIKILDLCTGSGVIGLCLAAELKGLWCLLTDNSWEALCWTRKNHQSLRTKLLSQVSLYLGDLCEPLAGKPFFDVVLANPPYVAPGEMSQLPKEVREYEPAGALDGGQPGGTGLIARIVKTTPPVMVGGALLALEIGENQQPLLEELFAGNHNYYHSPEFHRDLTGKLRFVTAFRK